MYSYGNGVKQDYLEAIKWHTLAGNNGNRTAQLKIIKIVKAINKYLIKLVFMSNLYKFKDYLNVYNELTL